MLCGVRPDPGVGVRAGPGTADAASSAGLLHQLFAPPEPDCFPLLGEDRLFSLVSNLFLYDLLTFFMLSTIKPLKHSSSFLAGMSQVNLWGENSSFLPSVREVSQSN